MINGGQGSPSRASPPRWIVVIPAIYALVKGWRLPSDVAAASANATAVEPVGLGFAAE
jgi:hypothetical protein